MGHTKHMSQSLADVDELLAANTTRVTKLFASLKSGTGDDEAALPVGEGTTYDDIWALRFCLSHEDDAEALSHARRTLAWRKEHAEMLELAGPRRGRVDRGTREAGAASGGSGAAGLKPKVAACAMRHAHAGECSFRFKK